MQQRKDEGFSLIELMVVVLVIAVLLAVAIPTFLGARSRAQDRAAQSRLRNAYTAEQVFYAGKKYFTQETADLLAIEPSLEYAFFDAGEPQNVGVVYVDAPDVDGDPATPDQEDEKPQKVLLAIRSETGTCWWIESAVSPGLAKYAKNDCSERPTDYGFRWPKL